MAKLYAVSLPPEALRRGFWLYVWAAKLPGGVTTHYVGMTGDNTGVAQSAFNRLGAHLGGNRYSNALRRAFGPLYETPSDREAFNTVRGKVARLERELWAAFSRSGHNMLNAQPTANSPLDEAKSAEVIAAFGERFRQLRTPAPAN